MAKNFSEEDIEQLKNKLRKACESSWKENGYKMTSIASLTKEVGVSTGSFYRVYETKEELFFEVFSMIQDQLKKEWNHIIQSNVGIDAFKSALKWLFREYAQYPRLYNPNNPDFILFLNKLPKENIDCLRESNENFFSGALKNSNISLKISEENAYCILSTLLVTATMENEFSYNRYEVFEFLLDSSINEIFNSN